jgi:Glycosyl transferase family 2
MKKNLTLYLLYDKNDCYKLLADELGKNSNVKEVILISETGNEIGFKCIKSRNIFDSKTMKSIANKTNSKYALIQVKRGEITPGQFFIERILTAAQNTSTGFVYSDFYEQEGTKLIPHPLIDYQTGSIRDDFDFGSFVMIEKEALRKAAKSLKNDSKYSGFYSVRLAISRQSSIFRIPEFLYAVRKENRAKTGEKQFNYVDPRNRDVQIEMERSATEHLKKLKAFLSPGSKKLNPGALKFDYEASVIIPVKNRERTIADSIASALDQKTSFKFNIIVVDNHSTDETTKILDEFSHNDKRVINIIPERRDLQIGGCWNEAIFHKLCGKFAVQLDSDDIYKDQGTLQKIVDKFYEERCGMVIGSYQLTDLDLSEVPPGIIDHREWSDNNGKNNALRINGLGAPRAFFTPLIRDIKFPNVSYGEDYSVVLAISRHYKVGRIYEPIYICRRWEGNTDSSLSIEQENSNNFYKDKIRTIEILARKQIMKANKR